jgi:gliding motility-associated lipoprotein GldD
MYVFMKKLFALVALSIMFFNCSDDNMMPKPKAQLRLEYEKPIYKKIDFKYFSFDKSQLAQVEKINDKRINLHYPKMKATVYLTYNLVKKNLDTLLRDAEKFTLEHTVKADEIITRDFINNKNRVFGSMNLVTGNAASQMQFHITDSLQHFIDGSLYFYAQPNYDSIMPAVDYLRADITKLLETLQWKNDFISTDK